MKGRTSQDYRSSSDSQLLDAFGEVRDERAFAEIVSRYGPMVMSTCRRRLRNEQDCQDAFQATFLTLVMKATWIREKSSIAGWLQRVAVRICIDLQRSNLRHQAEEVGVTEAKPVDTETTLMIEEELARLPANYRHAIVLCHLEGHGSKDAAEILGVPRNTLNSWLVRGRELMRKRLVRQGVRLSTGGLISSIVCLGSASSTVEASLIHETSRAALLHASGQLASTTTAASLAKATITKMLLTKLSTVTVLIFLPLCLLTVGVFEGHKALRAATLISDNFEGSFDGRWEVIHGDGRAELRDGKLVVHAGGPRDATLLRAVDANGVPITVTNAKMTGVISGSGDFQGGFVLRLDSDGPTAPTPSLVNGSPPGHLIGWDAGVFTVVDRMWFPVAEVTPVPNPLPGWLGVSQVLATSVDGPAIATKIYPVGNPNEFFASSGTNSALQEGQVGLWVVNRNSDPSATVFAEFDDIQVVSLVPEPQNSAATFFLAFCMVTSLGQFRRRSFV